MYVLRLSKAYMMWVHTTLSSVWPSSISNRW